MNTTLFLQSLELMGKGMLGIFVVILVIYGLVFLLSKLTAGGRPRQ